MNRSLIKLEVVDAICCLPYPRAVIAKALPTIHLRDSSLHEVTLTTDQVTGRAISQGLDSSPETCIVRLLLLLHVRRRVAEVVIVAIPLIAIARSLLSATHRRSLVAIKVWSTIASLIEAIIATIKAMLLSAALSLFRTSLLVVVPPVVATSISRISL